MKNKFLIVIVIMVLIGVFFILLIDKKSVNSSQIGTNVNNISPDFSLQTIEGESIHSEDLKGKVIVITSSAYWCSTCVEEALEFSDAYSKVLQNDVYFVTIDIDPRSTKDNIKTFQAQTNTPWDYADARGGNDIIEKLELNRFEITYVIDKNGVIIFKDKVITRSYILQKAIEEALNS